MYTVIVEPDEEAYHAYVPALPGCHTFGDTVDEALRHIQEAIALYIDGLIANDQPVPVEPDTLLVTRVPAVA